MLELLHDRDLIQQESRRELRARFQEFDIELVDVLIGKPDTTEKNSKIETLLEQLRLRQLSREQIVTFQEQSAAAEKLQALKMAQAKAEKQTELTHSQMEIQINENRGSAELAKARMQAEQTVVTAEAENKRRLLLADAESRSNALLGEGQSKRTSMEGGAEAEVLRQKVASFTDPKLYALSIVAQYLSKSQQPLVPERLFVTGANGEDGAPAAGTGLLGTLIGLLAAEKSGLYEPVPPTAGEPVMGKI
jgi:regulator of protease activity HflC (stomatin/prohibitin superfamily)